MRIIFYLISFSLILFGISSCSKGEMVKDPQFGSVSIINFPSGTIRVVQGDNRQVNADGNKISLISGKNRFRFYEKDLLLLDTSLIVEAFANQTYYMLKPNQSSVLKIVNSSLNNFDKEAIPDSGTVKISLANLTQSLPGKVNIYVSTMTYIPLALQPIQVGAFLNTSSSFSGFRKLITGKDQLSKPVDKFTLTIKDTEDKAVLTTINFSLPAEPVSGKFLSSVYLLYLQDNNSSNIDATILMSK